VDQSFKKVPKTCTELTERTMDMILPMFRFYGLDIEWTDEESETERGKKEKWCLEKLVRDPFEGRSRYCYDVYCSPLIRAIVNFNEEPVIKANGEIGVSVGIINISEKQVNAQIKLHLPEGFTCEYPHNLRLGCHLDGATMWNATVKAGDDIGPMNRIIMEANLAGVAMPALIPINILG